MEKGAQQRAHLLDVARDLFAAKGYEATTTRALNQAAGTSDGLLYYYFPHGKQDLLTTIVQEGLTQRMRAVQIDFNGVTSRQGLATALAQMVTQIWQLLAKEDNYQSFMITVRNRMLLDQAGSDWVERYAASIEDRLQAALSTVAPKLGYTPAQVPVLSSVIAALVIAPLFTELLLRNQRTLAASQHEQLAAQLRLVLQVS